MIKFNLERALRGDELITRNGKEVTDFIEELYGKGGYNYSARVGDSSLTFVVSGAYWVHSLENDRRDLFMKYEDKKTMDTFTTFTKSDLKTGMFVKYRNGEYRMVLGDFLSCFTTYNLISYYGDDLLCEDSIRRNLDIVAVYVTAEITALSVYLQGDSLTLLWERTQQTEAQKEMEVLNKKIAELQLQATRLQGKI